jgi:crotonobetainyl-CoA:carnitine CoA-transferase CaiB-like acyl-CoA transferase
MVLGDLGADVIKVERPGVGDDTRAWGPPFADGPAGPTAIYFLAVNRSRRSLTLDLRDPVAAGIAHRLAAAADVVLENFLPRHLASLGLEELRDRCPDTVWVSIRGAGSDGPAAALPGYDVMAQARSGLMSITGTPESGPTKVGVAIADVVAGLYAAVSALAGLAGASRGGSAPRIEVPLLESTISALVNQAATYLVAGTVPGPMGNDHPNLAPYGPVPCADRPLVLGAGNDRQFAALCDAISLSALATDPRFATNADRVANRAGLDHELAAVLATASADTWRARLEAAGVPCAPVNTLDEVFTDPHVQAVGLAVEAAAPGGAVTTVRSPLLVDGERLAVRRGPPALGEHTDAILAAAGFDAKAVAELRERGAV